MSVNKIILIGNLCHDPSVKAFESGTKVATFSLATNERGYKLANGTEVPERTEFHNIVIWGKMAEVAEKYLKKGNQLYVEGKSRTRSYEDKNGGAKRYVNEVFVDNMQMLTPKNSNSNQTTSPQTDVPPPDETDDLPF